MSHDTKDHDAASQDFPPEGSFLAFVRETDPNLYEWIGRTESTDDLRLAGAIGELSVAYKLSEFGHESPGRTLREGLARWLVAYHALRRVRDSMRFVRSLRRHLEPREEGTPDA